MAANIQIERVILLIENDEDDIFLVRRSLAKLEFHGQLKVVTSVSEARDYLEGRVSFGDRRTYPLPDLIVSDMNLPGVTGNVFLEWLRADERFKHVPFVFFSGSFLPVDQIRAKELGTDEFFVKTANMDLLLSRMTHILRFLPPDKSDSSEPPAA